MPWIEMPGGGHAHICMRGQRPHRCSFCKAREADKQCDFPVGKSGATCDAYMCSQCATAVAPEVDHCPKHAGQPQQGALSL